MTPFNLEQFHFLRPEWFALTVPLAFLCWRLVRRGTGAGVWHSICDEALLPYLLVHRKVGRSPLNLGALILGAIAAILALAGPTWERLPTPVFRDESALVVLLDLSRSMDATDISPSRLDRAKFKITDILRQRRDGQTALVVFAAEPYVVTPLTNDVATIESQLPALRTGIMPSQGSSGAIAIEKGIELLRQAGMTSGELLLVTDGMGPLELDRAKTMVGADSVRLSILGVGTTDGAPIPDENGGFITDRSGNIVLEPLRPMQLRELATAGNGLYQSIRTDENDVVALLALMDNKLNERNAATTDVLADRWLEVGPWLLLGLIPLAPFAFRRGVLTVIVVTGLIAVTYPEHVRAGWWATPDQEAQRAFKQGDFASAAQKFENDAWRASAHYRANSYEDVVNEIAENADPEAQYDKGNALARLGRLEEAIAAYDSTLSLVSDHEDALHNRKLLEELLEQQEQQGEEGQQQESESSDDSDSQDQSDGDQADGESEDQKNAEQKSEDSKQSKGRPDDQSDSAASPQNAEDDPEPAEEPEQEQAQTTEESDDAEPEDEAKAQMQADANSDQENEQATEQWLRQIPDDPGGLLRRKFEYEYQKKYGRDGRRAKSW